MSDKSKLFPAPATKNMKSMRPSTVSVGPTTSRSKSSASTVKEKVPVSRARINRNTTITADADASMMVKQDSVPDFDAEHRQIAYGKFLRAMLEDCIVDEKIEREETQMDIQMAQLADRFQKTIDTLDKTNRRLKDISFVVEHQRLLDLKSTGTDKFYQMTESSNAEDIVKQLNETEKACLDKLHTKNVDFGYSKESGHQKLLDAVNEAIDGLNDIRQHSNLDINKFKEYEKSQKNLKDLDKDRFELDSLKSDFESKFPDFSEKLLKEASDMIVKMIQNDEEDEEDD